MEQEITPDQSVSTLPEPTGVEGEFGSEEITEAVTRYVVVNINHNLYGISTESTVELMSSAIAQVTRVPHSPDFISGVINHRGTIIPVVDMRSLLGFEPRSAEAEGFAAKFEEFKKDHEKWLKDLNRSLNTNNAFAGHNDPAHCAFGKWYATVLAGASPICEMANEDPVLKSLIERLDNPHRVIHKLAEKVFRLKDEGKLERALEMVEDARKNELEEMSLLFEQVLESVSNRLDSMMVITEVGSRKAAVAVDGVSFVADCIDESIEPLPDTADNTEFLSGLVHQPDGSYILISDLESIYNIACPKE